MANITACLCSAIALVACCSALAQDQADELQRARNLERVFGDTSGAIEIYERIAEASTGSEAEAFALLELASAYRSVNERLNASAALQRIVTEYSSYAELVALARSALLEFSRIAIDLPFTEDPLSFAISPDGARVVYTVSIGGTGQLWMHDLATGDQRPIPGAVITDPAYYVYPLPAAQPFWSPDSRSIGYFSNGKLLVISASGGTPSVLADAPHPHGGSWSANGMIVYSFAPPDISSPGRLFAVPADGSAEAEATNIPNGSCPHFLPDGERFLVSRNDLLINALRTGAGIWIGSIDGAEAVPIPIDAVAGIFVVPDRLVYVSGDDLFVQRVDPMTFEFQGNRKQIDGSFFGHPGLVCIRGMSASTAGALAVKPTRSTLGQRQFVRMNRAGDGEIVLPLDLLSPCCARLSPDASRVVFGRRNGALVLVDLDSGLELGTSRGTKFATWSPDADSIAVGMYGNNRFDGVFLRQIQLSESGELQVSADTVRQFMAAAGTRPVDWSRDGEFILYQMVPRGDLIAMSAGDLTPLDPSAPIGRNAAGRRELVPVATTAANEERGRFSPNVEWVAFQSDEIDGRYEVFIQAFPGDAEERQRVSIDGGRSPAWNTDGSELFFLSPRSELMSAKLDYMDDGRIEVDEPVVLLKLPDGSEFDTVDGETFLINRIASAEDSVIDPEPNSPILVMTDWAP
jgi:hypothetical protein